VTDDPTLLSVKTVAKGINGVLDNALAARASRVVKVPVPGVPLNVPDRAAGGRLQAAPGIVLIRQEVAKLFAGGIRSAVNQQDVDVLDLAWNLRPALGHGEVQQHASDHGPH
jgi:hypothetical protein